MMKHKPNISAMKRNAFLTILLISLGLVANTLLPADSAMADPIIPPTWDAVSDSFESGSLDNWDTREPDNLHLEANAGHNGSTGLRVAVDSNAAYISQSRVGYAVEGYLTFWFNPNNFTISEPLHNDWPPENALHLAEIRSSNDDWWPPLLELYVRRPVGQGYQGFIAWPKTGGYFYDYKDGQFDLVNDWQKITLGYHIDSWVAVWVNDVLVHYYMTDVAHDDPSGDVIELGKVSENTGATTSGSILLDDVAFQVPRVGDLWVNANGGSDSNDGSSKNEAFLTIQKAANIAGPGTTVHILPGVYRETVYPVLDGTADERVTYLAEDGPGTVIIRGSEPVSSLTWTQLSSNTIGLPSDVDATKIYYADLSDWALEGPPRFLVQLDSGGNVTSRLSLAREPDWYVETEWKTHEFWWAADGGSSLAECDPTTDKDHNCDLPQRSATQLTDPTNDSEPAGVEPGNLTTLGDLTGARLVAMDANLGHSTYRRAIIAHDVANGRVTVDKTCGGSQDTGLGWGSKYYVEGAPRLLDNPGEWWYDVETKRLYLWPPTAGNPATLNIEISQRDNGFSLQNRSYTTLDGLTIEILNKIAVYQKNWPGQKSYYNTVRNATLRYVNTGVTIEANLSAASLPDNIINGFTLEDSEIAYIDTYGLRVGNWWWENDIDVASFTHSGILNTVIRNNEMHHLGFHSDKDSGVGLSFFFADKLRFENNHVHHVAHNGAQFSKSVIQSSKSYDFAPSEIKTGDILIKNNLFERACQLGADCGALKLWGEDPDTHVFRNVLITGNIFRNTYGWSYISEKRQVWSGGESSQVQGMVGFGLYLDYATGLHVYRNVAYNNAYADYFLFGKWRDGNNVYYNNIAANSLHGFALKGPQFDTHGNVNTQFVNNIIVNNEGYGVVATSDSDPFTNVTLDHNLYFNNGWRPYAQGGLRQAGDMVVSTSSPHSWTPCQTLTEIRANTPWEDHGLDGNPAFWDYNVDDHEIFDGSWSDFHLTSASSLAIEQGTADLPTSLVALLNDFGLTDYKHGTAYDIGRYEAGFAILAEPATQAIAPGGTAQYILRIEPNDLAHPITLTTTSPSPDLLFDLSPVVISASGSATLTLTDTHTSTSLLPRIQYTIPITGSSGGFSQTTTVRLTVGSACLYLPLVLK